MTINVEAFAPHISYTDLMEMAERSQPDARSLLFLPHLSGERSRITVSD
ncbi:hypothetical protein [Nostoc sp. CCY 9925]